MAGYNEHLARIVHAHGEPAARWMQYMVSNHGLPHGENNAIPRSLQNFARLYLGTQRHQDDTKDALSGFLQEIQRQFCVSGAIKTRLELQIQDVQERNLNVHCEFYHTLAAATYNDLQQLAGVDEGEAQLRAIVVNTFLQGCPQLDEGIKDAFAKFPTCWTIPDQAYNNIRYDILTVLQRGSGVPVSPCIACGIFRSFYEDDTDRGMSRRTIDMLKSMPLVEISKMTDGSINVNLKQTTAAMIKSTKSAQVSRFCNACQLVLCDADSPLSENELHAALNFGKGGAPSLECDFSDSKVSLCPASTAAHTYDLSWVIKINKVGGSAARKSAHGQGIEASRFKFLFRCVMHQAAHVLNTMDAQHSGMAVETALGQQRDYDASISKMIRLMTDDTLAPVLRRNVSQESVVPVSKGELGRSAAGPPQPQKPLEQWMMKPPEPTEEQKKLVANLLQEPKPISRTSSTGTPEYAASKSAGIARDETAATKEVAHEAKATRAASQEALQQLESDFCL
eukprot:m.642705 g.642705  ORF g.642705 m.642705 type:complete len:509 (-) comp22641_c0_seq14:373-1899(-)